MSEHICTSTKEYIRALEAKLIEAGIPLPLLNPPYGDPLGPVNDPAGPPPV